MEEPGGSASVVIAWPIEDRSSGIVLAPFCRSDLVGTYVSWLNDSVVMRFSNQRFRHHTEETCLRYLQSFSGTRNLFLSIKLGAQGRMIGTMTAYIAPPHGTADMGLMIGDRPEWGKGYGLSAWALLMEHLFSEERLRKITGGALDCNVPMIRIMEKTGMHLEAVRVRQELVDGVPHDIHHFARFGDD